MRQGGNGENSFPEENCSLVLKKFEHFQTLGRWKHFLLHLCFSSCYFFLLLFLLNVLQQEGNEELIQIRNRALELADTSLLSKCFERFPTIFSGVAWYLLLSSHWPPIQVFQGFVGVLCLLCELWKKIQHKEELRRVVSVMSQIFFLVCFHLKYTGNVCI